MARRVLLLPILATIAVLVGLIASVPGFSVGVTPMSLSLEAGVGGTADLVLQLTPSQKEERVQLSLMGLIQQRDGSVGFVPRTTGPTEPQVSVPESVEVPPGEPTEVKGLVSIPRGAKGVYHYLLLVEGTGDTTTPDGVLKLQVAYGVKLKITADGVPQQPSAKVSAVRLAKSTTGKPQVLATVQNTSSLDYAVTTEVTIRDAAKRLVERIALGPSGYHGTSAFELYPGSEVDVVGNVTKPLPVGEYDLSAVTNYADSRQATAKAHVQVKKGDYPQLESELGQVTVDPRVAYVSLKAGSARTATITFRNNSDVAQRLTINRRDAAAASSVFTNANVTVRPAEPFVLNPGSTTRVLVTVQAPRAAASQGNYGWLDVTTSPVTADAASAPAATDDVSILLSEVVTTAKDVAPVPQLAVGSIDLARDGARIDASVRLSNPGIVAAAPTLSIVASLPDGSTTPVSATLAPGEGVYADGLVLPGAQATFAGPVGNLPGGTYDVAVRVLIGRAEVARKVVSVSIPDQPAP